MKKFLIADLFCGAGGSSTGAERAVRSIGGQMMLVCINHWPVAIETHRRNHPTARHYIEDISVADPVKLVPEGYLDLLMASPECRFYSRARGGKPTRDQGRMNPFQIHNWLTKLDVRCALIENVPEFTDWGPLLENGLPDPAKKGMYFHAWLNAIRAMGYQAEYRFLNAADFGDATTRIRFFLIARKDGHMIRWPEPTHSATDGNLKPWRAAKEIINWDNPGRSLLDDPKYQKRPLSIKTLRRIARGLEKFGGALAPLYIRLLGTDTNAFNCDTNSGNYDTPEPFILNRHGDNGGCRSHDINSPVPTADTRGAGYIVSPTAGSFIMGKQSRPSYKSVDEPIPTVTTKYAPALIQPVIMSKQGHPTYRNIDQPIMTVTTEDAPHLVNPTLRAFVMGKQGNSPAYRSVNEPLPTITTQSASVVIKPEAKPFILGQHSCSAPRDTSDPIPTIATDGAISLVKPTIVKYYDSGDVSDIDKPLPTITTKDRFGLVTPSAFLLQNRIRPDGDRVYSLEKPMQTVTSHGAGALVNPIMVEVNHGGNSARSYSTDMPLKTITTNRYSTAVITPLLVQTGQTGGNGIYVRTVDTPCPTIVTKSSIGMLEPVAEKTLPAGMDPRRLVIINGELNYLDLRFRMLDNPELARAMGFSDAETEYEFVGNKSEITKQIGNAVPAHQAEALVKAILS